MKRAYSFLPNTGEYAGECLAQESPLEPGHYLLPAHATFTKPPKAGKNEVAVWNGSVWAIKPDFRGQTYWLADGTQKTMETIGAKPEGVLDAPPPPSLDEAKESAIAEINRKAEAAKEADITYKDVLYQADARSLKALSERLLALQTAGKPTTTTPWIAKDNTQQTLSFGDLAALVFVITERNQEIVLRARAKKDAVLGAKTVEEVAKVARARS